MNRLVLSNGVLNWASNKLLNLPRCGARPRTEGHRDSDRNVGILPLRHAVVAEPTPYQDTDEQHPRDLWVLHEEPRYVTSFFVEHPQVSWVLLVGVLVWGWLGYTACLKG